MSSEGRRNALLVRYAMFVLGLALMSFGAAVMIKADLGVTPWDTLHIGLQKTFGLTVGMWTQIAGAVIIFLAWALAKIRPNHCMILNMILCGLFLDLFLWMNVIPHAETFVEQLLLFLGGLLTFTFGIGLYISPRLGAGPRDTFMLALHEWMGWSIQRVRLFIEVGVLVVGWLLGGPVAIGTLLIALLTGPIIQRTIVMWEKLLEKPYGRSVGKKQVTVNTAHEA